VGHPIIATWVLGAIAILLTLGQGQKTSSVEHNTSVSKQADSSTDNINIEKDVASGVKKVTDSVVVSSDANGDTLALSKKSSVPPVISSVISNPVNKAKEITSNISDGVSYSNKNTTLAVSENELSFPLEKEISSESSVISDLAMASSDELLLMAREAYWNNGLDEAAQLYKQLIEAEPMVIDHKGELGNVYWRQGYFKKAAELYLEIAAPMIENGDSKRVANMIGFISLFFPEQAADLGNKMLSE